MARFLFGLNTTIFNPTVHSGIEHPLCTVLGTSQESNCEVPSTLHSGCSKSDAMGDVIISNVIIIITLEV